LRKRKRPKIADKTDFALDSAICEIKGKMVEARGIEPLSENLSAQASPGAGSHLVSRMRRRLPCCALGSFILYMAARKA